MAKKVPGYSEAAAEIEEILETIDASDSVDIDQLAEQVERAADLIRLCWDKLHAAELRVEKVTETLAEATGEVEESGEDE